MKWVLESRRAQLFAQRLFQLCQLFLPPEKIADLDKELATVVGKPFGRQQTAVGSTLRGCRQMQAKSRVNVRQVGVVSDINRRPRVCKVSEQNIEVHVLRGLQGREIGIRQQTVVLSNETQRKLARELIIPLRPDNVAVDYAVVDQSVYYALQNVGVVNLQAGGGFDADCLKNLSFISCVGQLTRRRHHDYRPVAKNSGIPAEHPPGTATKNNAAAGLRVLVITRKAREVNRP